MTYISDDPNLKHVKKEKYSPARRLMNLLDEVIFMSNEVFILKKSGKRASIVLWRKRKFCWDYNF